MTADAIGRGMVGTGLATLGMMLYEAGIVNTKAPRTDRAGRDMGESLGDPGNTIDWGPFTQQIERISPLANAILFGAYFMQATEQDELQKRMEELEEQEKTGRLSTREELQLRGLRETEGDRDVLQRGKGALSNFAAAAAAGAASIGSVVTEQPVFTGVTRAREALDDPGGRALDVIGRQVGSIVPSGAAVFARLIDPKLRDPRSAAEHLRARIPGLSTSVRPKRDALGGEVEVPLGLRLMNLMSPGRLSEDKTAGDTPEAKARRILDETGVEIQRLAQDKKMGETPDQLVERQRITGEILVEELADLYDARAYNAMDPAEKADKVRERIARARRRGNAAAKEARLRELRAKQR